MYIHCDRLNKGAPLPNRDIWASRAVTLVLLDYVVWFTKANVFFLSLVCECGRALCKITNSNIERCYTICICSGQVKPEEKLISSIVAKLRELNRHATF